LTYMKGNLKVAECIDAEHLAQDEAWWQIYRESFPGHEREPADVILKSVKRGVGLAFRMRRDGATIGIATTHLLMNPAAVFLVYLAIASTQRGAGLGRELLEFAWSTSASRLREMGREPLGMIWEVDQIEGRLAFFRRHGGVVLPRPYLQPPVNSAEPVPMQLMFRPSQNGLLPDADVTEALVHAMYQEKYGAVNGVRLPI
jgi:GNAT superfamily N-acetyltransferase